ncbi:NDP-hexose 2,3-dehydratase family protein [Streptomyces sp. WMMC897]|uniref:NDP-hexose 2,3-dehydratase family protein n=1 Tax=Streptomyces sp. WMMC897 TaxID=3014782 RepID=UPI0022B62759|nr:NDP-hexose 2,3-dehydratase family protein [Streptomyces sp. WMMC897]MCZ7417060.1 NDP-hexose 2,3-dehydratase family protein [Streptomyces sp. WMMC897]
MSGGREACGGRGVCGGREACEASGTRGAAVVPPELRRLLDEAAARTYTRAERVPLAELDSWFTDPATGTLRHASGGFFSVRGVRVHRPGHPVPGWDQPIIDQPETGVLGLLVGDLGGVRHCLVQLKPEPGNHNGIQISPTVQATRSNYLGLHGGRRVPYLEHFTTRGRHRVLADVRQSEQGAWFLRKRNRNLVLDAGDTAEEVPVLDHFTWLPLDTLHALLAVDDLVNMDTRSVLACLPPPPAPLGTPALHSDTEVLSWITDQRTATDLRVTPAPLHDLAHWHRDADGIRHDSGSFFEVVGVRVTAHGREVAGWCQPMLAPVGTGLVALLTTRVDGVPHVLLELRPEPGSADVAELAPTVRCLPRNYTALPAEARPPFLDHVQGADPARVVFDSVQSEEGGRFHHARTRHLIVESEPLPEPPGHRWLSLPQLTELLRHSHYVTMETRSLLACLRSLPGYGTSGGAA